MTNLSPRIFHYAKGIPKQDSIQWLEAATQPYFQGWNPFDYMDAIEAPSYNVTVYHSSPGT